MLYDSLTDMIGKTPLLKLNNFSSKLMLKTNLYAKVEYFNPTGSIKDRASISMVLEAEKNGIIKKGSTIIEPTSGNTGISLASIAASRGYKAIIVMPDSMSEERISLMKIYGAEIVLTDGRLGMKGAINKAQELNQSIPNSFIPSQFTNPYNPLAHYLGTGPEIWNDLNGNVDIVIAGVGTGGTISGIGRYLKDLNPDIKVIAVEPVDSPVLSKGISGPHAIQGIGAGFVPDTLDEKIYDEIITISNEDSILYAKMIAKTEGLLVGISSGASLAAAVIVGKRVENINKNIVVILPDSGDRYLSTALFK